MNKDEIIIKIQGKQIRIIKSDVEQFSMLVPFLLLKQISRYLKIQLYPSSIIHVFLYFIINVEKNLKIVNFDQSCRKRLFQYYFSEKMFINIKDYSILCGFILELPVSKCAHIIYLLVYGTFASAPYVQAICNEQLYKYKKQTFLRSKTWNQVPTKIKVQHSVKRIRGTNIEFQNFAKDLRDILRPMKRKLTTKPKQISIQLPQKNANNLESIPLRISNSQNSALVHFATTKPTKSNRWIKRSQRKRIDFVFDKTQQKQSQNCLSNIIGKESNFSQKYEEYTKELKKQNLNLEIAKFGKLYFKENQNEKIIIEQGEISQRVNFDQNLFSVENRESQQIFSEKTNEISYRNIEIEPQMHLQLKQLFAKKRNRNPKQYKRQRDQYICMDIENLQK